MIPVYEPAIRDEDRELVAEALRATDLSSAGRYVAEFEDRWAEYCGRKHGIATSNGTVALQLAVACLDLAPGDEVVMPAFTIVSCALAGLYNGAVPRLVDADPKTWCMDASGLERAVGPRTRAIMPVHIYGHPVDMDPLLDLARRKGLAVIEDAAEAHGAEYESRRGGTATWKRCGSLGDISCFSFYANKPVTTGEGGMLLTDDAGIAEKARLLRNLAFDPTRRFRHSRAAFNFRMSSLQAALGIRQVARMSGIVAAKRKLAAAYTERLSGIPGLTLPAEESWARSIFWMYGVVLEDAPRAEGVQRILASEGIETRPFFLGLHEQPAFRGQAWTRGAYPMTERLARCGFYLPSSPGLTETQIDQVTQSLRRGLSGL